MSAQNFARDRAAQLVATDPNTAFDLVIAADEMDKVAGKDPRVITLNRSMRKIKTEAIKYLNRALSGLLWSAGDTYDYLSYGSKFTLFGTIEAGGPGVARFSVEFLAAEEGKYSVRVYSTGKGNRSLAGDFTKEVPLDDIKKKPALWLAKAAKDMESHLKGSLDQEKQELLDYAETSVKELTEALADAKTFQAKVKASKNILADADDLRRAIPSVHDSYYGVRRILDEIKRAGG
jgi:hypothetical protein